MITDITSRSNVQKRKEAVIIIPIYKPLLDTYEEISLKFCSNHLNKYKKIAVSPKRLKNNNQYLKILRRWNLNAIYFENKYFKSIQGYNDLMLSYSFYDTFRSYKYILIYQLDALVLKDDLKEWIDCNYDYVGAPWICSGKNISLDSCGNGGFSLRKVDSFLEVLKSKEFFYDKCKFNNTSLRIGLSKLFIIMVLQILNRIGLRINYRHIFMSLYKGNEDYFWAFCAKFFVNEFIIPNPINALSFSFEVSPADCFKLNNYELPFGCHAWGRYDIQFWVDNIIELREQLFMQS